MTQVPPIIRDGAREVLTRCDLFAEAIETLTLAVLCRDLASTKGERERAEAAYREARADLVKAARDLPRPALGLVMPHTMA
jgi:hypothetical protein